MTDKTPEIHLKQLTEALSLLAVRLESLSNNSQPKPLDQSFNQGMDAGRFGSFAQSSTAIQLLLDAVPGLPANASDKDIKFMVDNALHEAGDVWD